MSVLRLFFDQNREIIHFGYGLVFFVLGLAVAFQSRRYSRLELARSLRWLAAFGVFISLYEWGELFAPVQEAYLSPAGIEALHGLHLVTLCAGFTCLFEFGVVLLRPVGRGQWLHPVSPGLLAVYFAVVLFILPHLLPDPRERHHAAEALARYFIAFPAGLLAAYGLREQTFVHIAPLDVPHIISTLRLAGVALALYGVFGGLLPPPVPFFPGNLLNTETFEAALGVPPLVVHSVIALVLAVTIIRALEVFDVETARLIETMEQQQILAAERDRLGRELHDGAIQTVYTAGLLIASARQLAEPGSALAARLERAEGVLDEAISDLRRNLVDLRSGAPARPLPEALRRLAEDPRFRSLIEIALVVDLPGEDTLSPARADHVLAIAAEALANVVRHAQARRAQITARREPGDRLCLTVQDDGIGLPRENHAGFGLRNMRDRARLLGGRLEVAGAPGKGATVLLDIPWHDER